MTGIVLDFSDELLLLRRLNKDAFVLNGYAVLRDEDIERHRSFSRVSDWRNRAAAKFKIGPVPRIRLQDWASCIASISSAYPLLTVHVEKKKPDVCYIGFPLEVTEKILILDDLDCNAEWSGRRRIRLEDVTRIDFDGGYERALAETAPRRKRSSLVA